MIKISIFFVRKIELESLNLSSIESLLYFAEKVAIQSNKCADNESKYGTRPSPIGINRKPNKSNYL